jgi:hypothetical protein
MAEAGASVRGLDLWAAAIGALAGAVLVTALIRWVTWPRDLLLAPVTDCALHESSCAASWRDGRLGLALGPQPLRCLSPLAVAAQLDGALPAELVVDFQGVDVPEAFHRTVLTPAGGGSYAGEAMLPLCATGSMRWQARVVARYGRRSVQAFFPFVTKG